MILRERRSELGLSDVDDLPPSRPALVQPRINADDLPDWSLRAVPTWPLDEAHPKERGEVMLQRGGYLNSPELPDSPRKLIGWSVPGFATVIARSMTRGTRATPASAA
jgi:hypothetical protein